MKTKGFFIYSALIFLLFSPVGCTRVRTYTVDKERVDQDFSAGNQGHLMGVPSSAEEQAVKNRRMTRKNYVAEVEVGGPYTRTKKVQQANKESVMVPETVSEPAAQTVIQEQASTAPVLTEGTKTEKVTSYIVEPNDTLQKISQKVYGTSKKWKMIFDANADQLKTPDRIFVGQVLKIPQE